MARRVRISELSAVALCTSLALVPTAIAAQQGVQGAVVSKSTDDPITYATLYLVGADGAVRGIDESRTCKDKPVQPGYRFYH